MNNDIRLVIDNLNKLSAYYERNNKKEVSHDIDNMVKIIEEREKEYEELKKESKELRLRYLKLRGIK